NTRTPLPEQTLTPPDDLHAGVPRGAGVPDGRAGALPQAAAAGGRRPVALLLPARRPAARGRARRLDGPAHRLPAHTLAERAPGAAGVGGADRGAAPRRLLRAVRRPVRRTNRGRPFAHPQRSPPWHLRPGGRRAAPDGEAGGAVRDYRLGGRAGAVAGRRSGG